MVSTSQYGGPWRRRLRRPDIGQRKERRAVSIKHTPKTEDFKDCMWEKKLNISLIIFHIDRLK